MAYYPDVIPQALPFYFVIGGLSIPIISVLYFIALTGTIVQTAIGVLEGVAERIDGWMQDKHNRALDRNGRSLVGAGTMIASSVLSGFGVIDLVARGYGSLAWGSVAFFIAPALTIGMWRIIKHKDSK